MPIAGRASNASSMAAHEARVDQAWARRQARGGFAQPDEGGVGGGDRADAAGGPRRMGADGAATPRNRRSARTRRGSLTPVPRTGLRRAAAAGLPMTSRPRQLIRNL